MLPELLTNKLQDFIVVGGRSYPIYTDFRNWVEIELILFEKRGSFLFKIPELLSLCYRELPGNLDEAIKGLTAFYCGSNSRDSIRVSNTHPGKRLYSFRQDAELLYGSFYQQYGIDLSTCQLHWWQFKALFQGLSQETKLVQVMSYRSVNLAEIQEPERRKFYRKMKELFKLSDLRTEEEREKEQAALMSALI